MLVVQPAGCTTLELPARRTLHYHFADFGPEEVFLARITRESPADLECTVASSCRSLRSDFRHHALNRIVARELLSHRCGVLWLRGSGACVLELARIAHLMNVQVVLELDSDGGDLLPLSPWLQDCLRSVSLLVHTGSLVDEVASEAPRACSPAEALVVLSSNPGSAARASSEGTTFDYSLYEFLQRDQPLLMRMQSSHVGLFEGCGNVLDLGCGAGLFLALLQERGIGAKGVERNERIAAYGRAMGLSIATQDALEYLQHTEGHDGIYCSHFVEHLPFEALVDLIRNISAALAPAGVAVLVFPDPESIRSQLLGFWRDPEHVRFYHPELIETLALANGLTLEWSSCQAEPHRIASFSEEPPPVDLLPLDARHRGASSAGTGTVASSGPGGRAAPAGAVWRRWFGGRQRQLESRIAALEGALQMQHKAMQQLLERTEQLWAVNRTWAWQDNAVLKFRKMSEEPVQ